MPEFWQNLTIGIVVAIVSAMGSAIVTVFLAFRRFRHERWWDRRADAYAAVIEALHHMREGTQDDLRPFEGGRPPQDDERNRERILRYRRACDEVHKAVDNGSFLFSEEAAGVLAQLMDDFGKAKEAARQKDGSLDPYEGLSGQLEAIERCLEKLPRLAKHDLGVR